MEMRVARTVEDLAEVIEATRRGFRVERAPKSAAADWSLVDGAVQHASGGFFSVHGVRDRRGEAVLLYQPQAAVTGLLCADLNGERHYLLQARAEPGCLGEVQYGPTVQSTPANFMRLHGGAATPYIEAFISFKAGMRVLQDTTQLDLGERYLFKSKRSLLIEFEEAPEAAAPFVWASADAIRQAASRPAFLNLDLRSILAIAPWSGAGDKAALGLRRSALAESLKRPVRPDMLGQLWTQLSHREEAPEFVPLQSLSNWEETDWGWSERVAVQGFDLDFFEVSAAHREVSAWVQPLVNAHTEGEAILACRERQGAMEVLVQVVAERGLSTTRALAPTYLRYPGAPGSPPSWLSQGVELFSQTTESDEGGRFFRDASRYALVRADAPDLGEDFCWINLAELKTMLAASNVCTIQMRALASQLLGL